MFGARLLKGRYERFEKIGEGAYGRVYRGKDINSNQLVAIKFIPDESCGEGVCTSGIREISILKELQHENVVKLIGSFFDDNDDLYAILEYMPLDLKKVIHDKDPSDRLSRGTVQSFLRQLLSGIAYCHENSILHRDLKPANLLIDEKSGVLKLADFGLSRSMAIVQRAWTSEVCTLWYRPPEILLGEKRYTKAVDMWSVGCIFAEMLQGKVLFPGTSQIDQLHAIFRFKGTPNETIWPGVTSLPDFILNFPEWTQKKFETIMSADTLNLLEQLLEYDPTKRISAKDALEHAYFKKLFLPS